MINNQENRIIVCDKYVNLGKIIYEDESEASWIKNRKIKGE